VANLFTNLAVPAGDGVGASVDTRAYGRIRTITVQGTFVSNITIEFSQDNTNFFPLMSFTNAGRKTVEIAAAYMRVRQSGLVGGTANVDVGAEDSGGDYITLPTPANDGVGAAVDVLTFGTFNTVVVSGTFTGTVIIEISEDNTVWAQKLSFNGPVAWGSTIFVARYMRVRRVGTDRLLPGTGTVFVGAIRDAGASAALGWLAATGLKVGAYDAQLNDLVQCNTTGGAFNVTLPLAAASAVVTPTRNYGGHLAVKVVQGTNVVNVIRSGADTIDGATTVSIPEDGCVIFVSDGVSAWRMVSINRDGMLNQVNDFTADQGSGARDLVDENNFATNCALGNYFRLTATGSHTMAAPTGMTAGHTYMWRFVSSGAGRVITFPGSFNFPNGAGFTTGTGGAGSVDIVTAAYNGTDFDCVGQPNMS
jgi:hypothetical protein